MSGTPPDPSGLGQLSGDRLPAGLEAASIVRRAESNGDFATVIRCGDADRGALVLIITSRGRHVALLERVLGVDGGYQWNSVGPGQTGESGEVASFLEKRARFDPDFWAIELDIANPERFIAETTAVG